MKLIPIKKETNSPNLTEEQGMDEKHLRVMEAILPYARKTPQKNLTDVIINNVTRKKSVIFLLLPEWAQNFPPYNLARLLAISKDAGFKSDAVDLNIKAFRDHKNWDIDFDPWHGSKEWRWIGQHYHEHLHKHLKPLMDKYIEEIVEKKFDIICFTLYYCNAEPTEYMAKELKRRLPQAKILVGGPQCHTFPPGPDKPYDVIVSGEGEEILLNVLEMIENDTLPNHHIVYSQPEGQRLNLDSLPIPDYSHFDLSDYHMPNGINAELSRGCTAKCVFCSETHFWKYRGRSASGILEEIITFNEKYGINFVWFLDSLVNGNLKELRAFCKGIIASGIKIKWTGYARCDKRMDFEYMKDLADSGCAMLSYGIESGSNKVLLDMDKRVTVDEIEQNLRDGYQLGIKAHSNWIIGFPTEQPQDFFETMVLMWRNKDGLSVVAAGHGFTEPPDTIISQNHEKFGMTSIYYLKNWITKDYKNSKVHRMIRLMSINIFLTYTTSKTSRFSNLSGFNTEPYHKITFNDPDKIKEVEFEQFDFNICKPNINDFADSVINEIWPLLRILYLAKGGYKVSIHLTKEGSYREFGDRLGCGLDALYNFEIDDNGKYFADFSFNFVQDKYENADAWNYCDFTRENSIAAKRARILALPGSDGEAFFNKEKYDDDMRMHKELKNVDFSFTYNYKSEGKW